MVKPSRTSPATHNRLILLHRLITAIQSSRRSAQACLAQYPKQFAGLFAALLLGGVGATYALAAFAPDPAEQTIRQVVESIALPELAGSANLDAPALNLYRSDLTRASDTADSLLRRLGVDDPSAAQFLRSDANARKLLGRSGRLVTAEATKQNTLQKLSARWSAEDDGQFKRLVIEPVGGAWASRLETAALTVSTRLASGSIQSSLFAATDEARIPDAVAVQVAEIFSGDIDFHRALRKGDRFSIVYETLEGDGEPLRSGRVLSAEFVNGGKKFQAMWFREPVAGAKGGYYTLDGQSLRRVYLASPMEFSRITSGFKMRFHPILQKWAAHRGLDYAAATGTPVRSVGEGVVEFAGVQNGFGNVVFIKHRNQHTTVYAHLSRLLVRHGQAVTQGQHIGAVGATGWATGPHLHFEFRVNGQHQDPLTLARQSEAIPVSASARPAFGQRADAARVALMGAASLQRATAD